MEDVVVVVTVVEAVMVSDCLRQLPDIHLSQHARRTTLNHFSENYWLSSGLATRPAVQSGNWSLESSTGGESLEAGECSDDRTRW